VGFELTFPAFERAKTFHALERIAIVISIIIPFTFESFSSRNGGREDFYLLEYNAV
jgi:hypothetical protein